jgi:polyisoprenoid-binding protein YceI
MKRSVRTLVLGLVLGIALVGIGSATTAEASNWKVDTAHTTVGFSVSHLFTSVQGRFDRFEGAIQFDPAKPEDTAIHVSVESASINTNHAKRDKHLRSDDFFDVEKFPELTFVSTKLADWSGSKGKLHGKLTIHGVTRDVVFDVDFLGQGADPWGNVRAGFRARLTIDRKDYGLKWNQALETGGVLVGDEVEIRIDAEGLLDE